MKSYIIPLAALAALLASCNDDLSNSIQQCSVDVRIEAKDNMSIPAFDSATLTFTDLSSGMSTPYAWPMPAGATVLPGLYDITFEAKSGDTDYFAVSRSVEIISNGSLIRLELYSNRHTDDLIIAEIFFTGTLQSSGNQYYGDDYVKLYNNTDHVIYADGLTLFESKFLTTEKRDYTPDRMAEGVTVQALYTIPGSGTDHPVAPGEYILLADTGIDHRQINPNSFDLSHADWEWYDVSTVPSTLDIDSPLVDNLDKWYCYTKSIFLLHNRGFRAIGIARLPEGKDKFLADAWYEFDYEIVSAAGTFPMTGNGYLVPNSAVVDVVNCSAVSVWQWNVTDPSLDRGWTHCGVNDNDKTRYFHSVRRKLLYVTDDGRPVFKDTNNSTEDFNPMVTPSEIELQGTVTGLGEGTATTITYDGVTPVRK